MTRSDHITAMVDLQVKVADIRAHRGTRITDTSTALIDGDGHTCMDAWTRADIERAYGLRTESKGRGRWRR